jgi:hypothetical protein
VTSMAVFEIPRERWVDELNAFTITHEGWLVSLDLFGPDVGAQPEIDNLPLLGVSADSINHDDTIAISVARSTIDHFAHMIRDVTWIYVEHVIDGTTAGLLVKSAGGTRTVLQLRAIASPARLTSS